MACTTLKRSLDFEHIHSPLQRPPKRRRCMPLVMSSAVPPTKLHHAKPSPFGEVLPKYTTDIIQEKLHAELKRMRRRRELIYERQRHLSSPVSSGSDSSSDSEMQCSASTSQTSNHPNSSSKRDIKEQPLFSLKQVGLVCERLIKERETQMREEYDKVLIGKLAEQYDMFVKFSHDQIMRRFADTQPSYVS